MARQKILYFLFCINFVSYSNSVTQNVPSGKLECATDVLKKFYLKHNYTYEKTNKNDNLLVQEINKFVYQDPRAAYCGSAIYYIVTKSGYEIEIPKVKSPVARNWGLYGEVVWSNYSGWKSTQRKPNCDEIFVVLFTWNGRNHCGLLLESHGGLNLITGEGNTSDSKVRNVQYLYYDNTKEKRKDVFIPYKKNQGFFAAKERYNTAGLVKIIKYKVKKHAS